MSIRDDLEGHRRCLYQVTVAVWIWCVVEAARTNTLTKTNDKSKVTSNRSRVTISSHIAVMRREDDYYSFPREDFTPRQLSLGKSLTLLRQNGDWNPQE